MARLKVDNISAKFFFNDVDILLSLHIETDFDTEQVNTIKLLDDFTSKLRTAGAYSVKASFQGKPYSAKESKADGTHPDDLLPAMDNQGKPKLCPQCQKPLGIAVIIAGPKANNPGQKYGKYVHAEKTACKWDKDKERPQWVKKEILAELLNRG